MRQSLGYALLFAVPSAFTVGSAVGVTADDAVLGLLAGGLVGGALFAIVLVAAEQGTPDESMQPGG